MDKNGVLSSQAMVLLLDAATLTTALKIVRYIF